MTENLHATLVDIGCRLDALDVKLGNELARLRRRGVKCSGETPTVTGATHNSCSHNSDHRGAVDTPAIEDRTPAIHLSLIYRHISEEH